MGLFCPSNCCCFGTENRRSTNNHDNQQNQSPPPPSTITDTSEYCHLPVKFKFGEQYPSAGLHVCPSGQPRSSIVHSTLEKIPIVWKSPLPLTRAQLQERRAEFWETASAYGGRPEIWQVLREAIKVGPTDMDTARALLQGAGVTVPSGQLTEAYDERGFKYIIPVYCLCDPENSLMEESPDPQSREYEEIEPSPSTTKTLIIRFSDGHDLPLDVPGDNENVCLGHIRRRLQHLDTVDTFKFRLEFFWSGHGPLDDSVKLRDLCGILNDEHPIPLQVWLLPKLPGSTDAET